MATTTSRSLADRRRPQAPPPPGERHRRLSLYERVLEGARRRIGALCQVHALARLVPPAASGSGTQSQRTRCPGAASSGRERRRRRLLASTKRNGPPRRRPARAGPGAPARRLTGGAAGRSSSGLSEAAGAPAALPGTPPLLAERGAYLNTAPPWSTSRAGLVPASPPLGDAKASSRRPRPS